MSQNERATGLAWRDDAGGLLYAAASPNTAAAGIDPPPQYTAVRIVNFATNQVNEVKRLGAARFAPLTWRVATHVVSGVDQGEGGVRAIYRFKEDGGAAGDTPPDRRFSDVVDTSRDETAILGQFAYGEAGKTFSGVAGIGMQDASMQESMGPIVDRTKENLVSTDNGIIMARHRLLRAIKNLMDKDVTPPGVDTAHQRVRSAALILPPDQPFKEGAREALIARPQVAPVSV